MSRHCITVMDILKEPSRWETPGRYPAAERVVSNLKRLITFGHDNDTCVAFIQDPYLGDYLQGSPGGSPKDTKSTDPVLGLHPDQARGELLVVQKNSRLSAFAYTDFDHYLREKSCDTVVVTGVETNAGVRITASDALYHAYKVICISDCCTSSSEFMHKAGLRDLEMFSEVVTLQEYMYKYSRVRT